MKITPRFKIVLTNMNSPGTLTDLELETKLLHEVKRMKLKQCK